MVLVLGYLNVTTVINSVFKTRLDTVTWGLLYAHSEQESTVAGLTGDQRQAGRGLSSAHSHHAITGKSRPFLCLLQRLWTAPLQEIYNQLKTDQNKNASFAVCFVLFSISSPRTSLKSSAEGYVGGLRTLLQEITLNSVPHTHQPSSSGLILYLV